MDISDLKAQSMGLHAELEAMGQQELKIVSDMEKLSNHLKTLRFRKEEYKKAIERNLDQQEVFWDLDIPKVAMDITDISALEEYLIDPNNTIKSIANNHGISGENLARQISNHFKVSA